MKNIVFIDLEVGISDKKIKDTGAVKPNGNQLHTHSIEQFNRFIDGSEYLCGHNIVNFDLKFLQPYFKTTNNFKAIDTLYLSPLLFPKRPYHNLVKDDKLQSEEINNPLNDSIKAEILFWDEIKTFETLSSSKKQIYYHLLNKVKEFEGFFDFIDFQPQNIDVATAIRFDLKHEICESVNLQEIIDTKPVELAYAIALISTYDKNSVTPPWLLRNFPNIENILKSLRDTPCYNCDYCNSQLNVVKGLKKYFGYDQFRKFNGEALQERAARAAMAGKSLLALFPTGGGKSITFQLPALMAGELLHGLTVVISPLQSLMKDQVDNLNERGLTDAVTINGMLSPLECSEAIDRVSSGQATLLYISPEQLRSKTIENLLLKRHVVRFVIDEAHCFSAWGQDFRVDYLYIGDFIKEYQRKKKQEKPIAVSCFTATAKQKVISDIKDYFKRKLDLNLELYATNATRENLHYIVLHKETDEEKYNTLRALIEQHDCPTIVYVSRVSRTLQLAEKLTRDGYPAFAYNGKMEASVKIANQEAFINNQVKVMVATSAFGMGVDKKDVGLVIHFDISDSLENYVQEAGRAGRDQSLQAECFVLFNDNDLDKHFILLNQTKLSISEIQQVWKAMKDLTKLKPTVCCSALEIARQAGWNDGVSDIETRVRTAISALENAGYVKRGRNVPHVYATSIKANNFEEAGGKIERSKLFETDLQRTNAKRIIQHLISSRSIAEAENGEAESKVDYLADILGIPKREVIGSINMMRQDGLLEDYMDMSAFIQQGESQNRASSVLERFFKLENFIISLLGDREEVFSLKELNEQAEKENIAYTSVKNIRTIFYFLSIKGYIRKEEYVEEQCTKVIPLLPRENIDKKFRIRIEVSRFIIKNLYENTTGKIDENGLKNVTFSLIGLFNDYNRANASNLFATKITLDDVEEALLYLQKIGAMKLEGGFLVLYNGMEIKRLVLDNRTRYKLEDYKQLNDYYKQKIQQIHIVGEYANLMVRDYDAALQFVQDYFVMDFKEFINKYFKGERATQIERNITPEKYNELFGNLSDIQSAIINDKESKYIVVAAGPGSGKTRVLVHKLAALLLLEDVKHEQLLMLTFSRAAATEFKKRLIDLVGNAAHFVEIKTFHSYSFDLLGKIGCLENAENVVKEAAVKIENGEVEPGRIMKSVLVIDEAQDMDSDEFALVTALMKNNEEMRVIAVGDDDQNIYEFRGSDSKYMQSLISEHNANHYELLDNYRSKSNIVRFSNVYVKNLFNRMKQHPIVAVQEEEGRVCITRHYCKFMEEPLLNDIKQTYTQGTACVLTTTNSEAANMVGLLQKNGLRAKLIQSLDSLRLCNMAEIRLFLKTIEKQIGSSPTITEIIWKEAKEKLNKLYGDSKCIEACNNMIEEFERANTKWKYWTDLKEFINESNLEDFYTSDTSTILVSTIHKAKGREFDNVYLLLNNYKTETEESKRVLYVGMTRAKSQLSVHTNTGLFSQITGDFIEQKQDYTQYSQPEEIVMQFTHRDVVLDFFKNKKNLIFKLRSGSHLKMQDEYLVADIEGRESRVAKFSKACITRIEEYKKSGYKPKNAEVSFIVAWKGEEDTEETAVLLPSLTLSRELN